MRRLFITATLLFWIAVLGFWAAGVWLPQAPPPAQGIAQQKVYVLPEVAKHGNKDDCWMVIAGQVYDLSKYVPQHPSDPAVLLPWCGKEATQAYKTKGKDRPHSAYADRLLPQYWIGSLKTDR